MDTTDDYKELFYTDENGTKNQISLDGVETLTTIKISTNDGPDGMPNTDDDYKEIVYKDEKGDETALKIGDLETLTKLAVEDQ